MRTSAIVLAAATIAAVPALANDTSAELSTGGLIFVGNENVEMRSEELAISTTEVSVRYRFFNKSDRDVTVLVAFPMPDVHVEGSDEPISVPTEDPVNLLGFTTSVNGTPVSTARNCCAGSASLSPRTWPAPTPRSTACRLTSGRNCCVSDWRRSKTMTPATA
jgi:hypothetical protein